MLLKANNITAITVDRVTYAAENGLIDAPISPQEAILFGLDAPTAEEIAALTKDADDTSGDNAGGETGNGQNADTSNPDSGDTGGKKTGGKSGGKDKDVGDGTE
ncbi:MAG: hypothetical protein ACFNLO_10640 [Selenomonas massiliensis]